MISHCQQIIISSMLPPYLLQQFLRRLGYGVGEAGLLNLGAVNPQVVVVEEFPVQVRGEGCVRDAVPTASPRPWLQVLLVALLCGTSHVQLQTNKSDTQEVRFHSDLVIIAICIIIKHHSQLLHEDQSYVLLLYNFSQVKNISHFSTKFNFESSPPSKKVQWMEEKTDVCVSIAIIM